VNGSARLLLDALGRRRRDLVAVAAWAAVQAAPALVLGRAVAGATDAFVARHLAAGFAWLAVLAVAAAAAAVGGWRGYRPMAGIVESFRDDLVGRVASGALRSSMRSGPAAGSGVVSRLTYQVEVVRETFAGLVQLICTFAFTAAGSLLGLLTLAPIAAAFVLPPMVAALALLLAMLRLSARRQRAAMLADEAVAATATTVLGSLRDIVASGAEDEVGARIEASVDAQARAVRALAELAAARTLTFAAGGWVPLAALVVAAPWLLGHGITAGTLLGMLAYVRGGLQPALQTLVNWAGGSGMLLAVTLGRIAEVSEEPAPPAAPPARRAEVSGHVLEVRGVTFRYGPSVEPVLRDLDLVVPEGDHLAIVGPSGIGKSTLAGVLAGMLRPVSGEVRLGGVDVAGLDAARLPGCRVLIPQEAYVFAGSVWENLAYLRPEADVASVDAAVDAVGLRPVVERLGGLCGPVEPAALSAGERQLVALARAYLSPAPIALLDEATCHLDPAAEARAERAFASRPGTLVVVAHRVSSALRARRILVMDGAHATVGTHDALLTRSALYRDLVGHWQSAPSS
jgi:ATP-binding cassette, subfamily C, bacterial